MTLTEEGRKELSHRDRKTEVRSSLSPPQILGTKQKDDKFVCGADGDRLEIHPPAADKTKTWMCTACGQIYVDFCLSYRKEHGIQLTTCTGAHCAAARQGTPLISVLRKMGTW